MQLEIKKYLFDIQISIESINEFIGEKKDFNHYKANKMLRRSVEREFEIIGEAASKLLKFDSKLPISNARKIVDLRNWVIHGYDRIDDAIIWGVIIKDLPILKNQVLDLLSED
jgi:uncharacterized protein with HEPN domain